MSNKGSRSQSRHESPPRKPGNLYSPAGPASRPAYLPPASSPGCITWGETASLELLRGSQKLFSFQISQRTRYLDQPVPAKWQPLWIETLRDNVASKMTALVERGAPRDLRDVFELCHEGLTTIDECWSVWQIQNPHRQPPEGPEKVMFYIEKLELMRPLDKMPPETRPAATVLRQWYRDVFCPAGPE